MGVADQSAQPLFPEMTPVTSVNNWRKTNALFKLEGTKNPYVNNRKGVVNIGLGDNSNPARAWFNTKIQSFSVVPSNPNVKLKDK